MYKRLETLLGFRLNRRTTAKRGCKYEGPDMFIQYMHNVFLHFQTYARQEKEQGKEEGGSS